MDCDAEGGESGPWAKIEIIETPTSSPQQQPHNHHFARICENQTIHNFTSDRLHHHHRLVNNSFEPNIYSIDKERVSIPVPDSVPISVPFSSSNPYLSYYDYFYNRHRHLHHYRCRYYRDGARSPIARRILARMCVAYRRTIDIYREAFAELRHLCAAHHDHGEHRRDSECARMFAQLQAIFDMLDHNILRLIQQQQQQQQQQPQQQLPAIGGMFRDDESESADTIENRSAEKQQPQSVIEEEEEEEEKEEEEGEVKEEEDKGEEKGEKEKVEVEDEGKKDQNQKLQSSVTLRRQVKEAG